MVAETVLRTTFMSLAMSKNQDAAVVHAINTLTYNAIHLSLIPVLQVGLDRAAARVPGLQLTLLHARRNA